MPEASSRESSPIRRIVSSPRWADVVLHTGTAYWVEVAEDPTQDARGQIAQVLAQIDATLSSLGSDRSRLLQVLIHVCDLGDVPVLNTVWDAWIQGTPPPVRACVQSGLAPGYKVEMVLTAAV